MAEDIEKLVEEVGERGAFVRWHTTPAAVLVPPAAPEPAATAAADPATTDLSALAGQLVDALDETPVVLPGSELTWVGSVVQLADYDGPHADIARAAAEKGHTLGLVTEVDGLLCVMKDDQNPEHYEALAALAGSNAEVFGLLTEDEGLTVVRVTLCRKPQ